MQTEKDRLGYVSLKTPCIIDPQKKGGYKGAHISLPDTGILCGKRQDWVNPAKYQLERADSSQFEFCSDCLTGLADNDTDRFEEIFPERNIDDYLSDQDDTQDTPTPTNIETPPNPSPNTTHVPNLKTVPSNVSQYVKSELMHDGCKGYLFGNCECGGGWGKRSFELVGRWGLWWMFEYRRFCKNGHVKKGIAVPKHTRSLTHEAVTQLQDTLLDTVWEPAETLNK